MNAFVKKEICLLLPSWLAVLALEVLLPWFWRDADISFGVTPIFIFLGMILLAVDSFGRECSLGTFQSLLAQPMERRQIWRLKISVLFLAAILILAAYVASCGLRLHLALAGNDSIWHGNSKIIQTEFQNAILGSIVAVLVALVGGLWTALLFRQPATAFWVTLLVPAGLMMLIALVMSEFFNSASNGMVLGVLFGAAGLYVISGFWLAHRLFHRAQDVVWTGGIISFSKWRYFDNGVDSAISVRRWKPFSALLKKEFQLNSISLMGVGALLALHLAVFFLRAFYGNFHRNSLASVISDMFWVLWLVMPLLLGCMAVAEERKLGVTEVQFCLPVSRRFQFAIKFIPTIFFGVLLGGVMPLLLEMVAGHFGAPNDYFKPESHSGYGLGIISGLSWFDISLVALAAGLALVGFFASTLAKNFLQALSIAIVTIVGCCLFVTFLVAGISGGNDQPESWGMRLWGVLLPVVIGMFTMICFVPWLAYRNFSRLVESGRLWRRNLFAVMGAVLFIFASSTVIYNRAWEMTKPAEPPHGPAILSSANSPTLHSDHYNNLQVKFPGGQIWFNSLGHAYFNRRMNDWAWLWWTLYRPLPVSAGPQQFMAGSNWISATTQHIEFWNSAGGGGERQVNGFLDTVGIQADGSLWISSEAKAVAWTGAKMMRFGDETNWQQVVQKDVGFLLLKRDGTLWQWGTNRLDWSQWQTRWPTVRAFLPQPLGTNSDWQEIFNDRPLAFARKNDGSVWRINWDWKIERDTNLDQIVSQTVSFANNGLMAWIGKDGTLWSSHRYWNRAEETRQFFQVSKETNWVTTEINWGWLVALKSDGSLWQWHFDGASLAGIEKRPPTRLGLHRDWIGLAGGWDGTVTLAADGSLWFWPDEVCYLGALMKAPKQPQPLGQVPVPAAR